jgi:outer membrane protein OmpA-like peptidoglycan-associated protein
MKFLRYCLSLTLYKKLRQSKQKQIIVVSLFLIPSFSFGQVYDDVETFYYAPNNYRIEKKNLATLNAIGQKCSSDTFVFLKIFAYADTKGSIEYNELLSQKRAEAVYNYLIKHFKFDAKKVYVTWLGEETDGAYDLHFPEAHVQQRCVDIIVSFKKGSD